MNTAAYIDGPRSMHVGAYTPVARGADTVAVSIETVGICGSDLHYYKEGGIGPLRIASPFVPGHEFSARLAEDVEQLRLTRGSLVAVDPARACGACEWCAANYENLCPHTEFFGCPPIDGALTQTLHVPRESLVPLPEGMSADQAALLEPLGVCIHAMDLAPPRPGNRVAVLGCGPIGLGMLQLLRDAGVDSISCVDPQAHRHARAIELGATQGGPSLETVREATAGRGADLVFEASNSPRGLANAIAASAIGARVVLIGIPDGDRYTLSSAEARRRGLTVRFSRRMGHVYPRAIELVASGRVDVDRLVTHRFGLEEAPTAFALQADETVGLIKSLVYPAR